MREEKFKFHSNDIVCRFIHTGSSTLTHSELPFRVQACSLVNTVCALLADIRMVCALLLLLLSFPIRFLSYIPFHSFLILLMDTECVCAMITFVAVDIFVCFSVRNANFDVAFWYSRCYDIHDLVFGGGVLSRMGYIWMCMRLCMRGDEKSNDRRYIQYPCSCNSSSSSFSDSVTLSFIYPLLYHSFNCWELISQTPNMFSGASYSSFIHIMK